MIDVSDNFKTLAQQNGRQVYCKITAGIETFLDDRILEFDFDDVIHPDWFTVGTTCSNRFAFTVLYSGELKPGDRVEPFISFDGEEWCPLGIFYVSRRYIRGKHASITCYDKMYFLDMEYSCTLSMPSDTEAILQDACRQGEISCEGFGTALKISNIPENATVRDIIGYIAAINRGCAKISRDGMLINRKYSSEVDFILSAANCIDYSRNMSKSKIQRIVCDNGRKILEKGSGAVTDTLELYNPFMNTPRLEVIYTLLNNFSFFGAEAEIQGMPFLESGDVIKLSESDDEYYKIVISEIEYHYDGGLTAHISSRNRAYSEAAVHTDDLEAAVRILKLSELSHIRRINENEINLSQSSTVIADFSFETDRKDTFAQLDINFTLNGSSDNVVNFRIYVNGECERELVHMTCGEYRELIHIYHLADKLPAGKNRIYAEAFTTEGTMYIHPKMLLATLVMQGIETESGNYILCSNEDKSALIYGCGAEKVQTLPPSSGSYVYSVVDEIVGTQDGESIPALRLYKQFRLSESYDNYTDSIIGYIDGVDLTDYSKLVVSYNVFTEHNALPSVAYFAFGEQAAVTPQTAYNWSGWTLMGESSVTADLSKPASINPDKFTVDISNITGVQRLNFGLYHGNAVWAYAVGLFITQIELIE